jgi:hypothetical protein
MGIVLVHPSLEYLTIAVPILLLLFALSGVGSSGRLPVV